MTATCGEHMVQKITFAPQRPLQPGAWRIGRQPFGAYPCSRNQSIALRSA